MTSAQLSVATALVALLAANCQCVDDGRCHDNAACDATGQGYRSCDIERGVCLCNDDRGCGENEQCNALGSCQVISGCVSNEDCGAEQFCDVLGGTCVVNAVCGSSEDCCTADAHCAYGSVCDKISFTCVAGCRDGGDCRLGQGCESSGLGRLGTCGSACTNDALCSFGALCELDSGTCIHDGRGPYCYGCSGGVQSDDCGEKGNYCLLDTVNGGAYCGVDCSQGQACPNGYECRDVIILPQSTLPTCALPEGCVDNVCERSGTPCSTDEQCPDGPPGSTCPRADVGNCDTEPSVACTQDSECEGTCLKQECRVREGAAFGVCSCTKDTDCPRDRCLDADTSVTGHGYCELSGHPCFEDFDCDVISCQGGGCLLGRNCKPSNDRTCVDLLDEPPASVD